MMQLKKNLKSWGLQQTYLTLKDFQTRPSWKFRQQSNIFSDENFKGLVFLVYITKVSYQSFWQNEKTSAKSRVRRGDGVLTMPMATNYEFGGSHVYDTFEDALNHKNLMVKELTEKFGPKSIFVKQWTPEILNKSFMQIKSGIQNNA